MGRQWRANRLLLEKTTRPSKLLTRLRRFDKIYEVARPPKLRSSALDYILQRLTRLLEKCPIIQTEQGGNRRGDLALRARRAVGALAERRCVGSENRHPIAL